MVEPIHKTRSEEIRKYCEKEGLNYEKLRKCGFSGGPYMPYIFQYIDRENNHGRGLYEDGHPAPVVLEIEVVDGILKFSQTKDTRKYLV